MSTDIYGHGRPTRIAYLEKGAKIEQYVEELPVSESIFSRTFEVPWFKHYRPEIIEEHANAYKKVIKNYEALLADDTGKDAEIGAYTSFFSSQPLASSVEPENTQEELWYRLDAWRVPHHNGAGSQKSEVRCQIICSLFSVLYPLSSVFCHLPSIFWGPLKIVMSRYPVSPKILALREFDASKGPIYPAIYHHPSR